MHSQENGRAGLRSRFLKAAKWSLIGYGIAQVLRLASNLLLTRMLAPELFGVMAVAGVVMSGLIMFSDMGLGQAAIRSERGDEPTFLNVVWVTGLLRGLVITTVAWVVAGGLWLAARAGWLPTASVYSDPLAAAVVGVVALSGVISSFESTKVPWNRRHLNLAQITRIELACQLLTTVFILAWAALSPSIWALVGGWLFGAGLKVALTHLLLPGPSNRFEWETRAFHELWNFGKWVFLSSALSFLLTSGDRLLLGLLLDSRTMGLYAIAFMLVDALQSAMSYLVGSAALPALSEVHRERPQDLARTLYRIRGPIDRVSLAVSGALFALSGPIVHVLYDNRYAEVGWMLGVLALTLVASRLEVFNQCLVAMGRIRTLSALNATRAALLAASILVGFAWGGAIGAVWAVPAAALLNGSVVLFTQSRLKLFDLRAELSALPFFFVAWAGGWLLERALARLLS